MAKIVLFKFCCTVSLESMIPSCKHQHTVTPYCSSTRHYNKTSRVAHSVGQRCQRNTSAMSFQYVGRKTWQDLPNNRTNQAEEEVEGCRQQIGQRDVVREAITLNYWIIIIAIKQVWILHKTLKKKIIVMSEDH